MTRKVMAVLSDADRGPRYVPLEDTWESFKAIVGNYMEGYTFRFRGVRCAVYCDEDGYLKDLAPSVVSPTGAVVFRGPVVVTIPDEEGNDNDVPSGLYGWMCMTARTAKWKGREVRVLVCDQEPACFSGAVE